MDQRSAIEEGRQVFVEESRELLQEMEAALLQLEGDPADADAINALFRAAHTIKGSAGLFDYREIVGFTHVVESVLDRVRGAEIAIDANLMSILLPCCDHVGVLIRQVCGGDVPRDDTARQEGELLLRDLEAYLGGSGQKAVLTSVPRMDLEREDLPIDAGDAWHISLRFGRDVLRNGMDPMSFIRYLGTVGEIVGMATVDGDLSFDDSFDPESCYLGFELRLQSGADKKTIEDVFEFVRGDCVIHILPPQGRVHQFLALLDVMPGEKEQLGELLIECGALTPNELGEALASQRGRDPAPRLGEILVGTQTVQREVVDAALDKQQKIQASKAAESRFVRVAAEKLDSLITLVGELVIAGAGANLLARKSGIGVLQESTANVNALTEEIRESALRLRMVQIGETFNRFHRIVRDLSRSLGKDIALAISGADTELDKMVVEKIADPLTHLVRNAMDHGIEAAELRAAVGKPSCGSISLNAYHDSGSIVIEVSDDGKGLDRERILAKARDRGLLGPDETPNDDALFKLVFEPGFSTADQVSDLSGRGVGMDVVRRNIEALRGQVSLESRMGEGTKVTVRLPLTLAIIDGFLVQVERSAYVLPLDMVVECVELPGDRPRGADYLNLRGQVLPYLSLRELFDLEGAASARESVVVVQFGSLRAGIVVDKLLGEAQTVIKPLGKLFSQVQGISGSTILGTGEVALILDVPALVQRATQQRKERAPTRSPAIPVQ